MRTLFLLLGAGAAASVALVRCSSSDQPVADAGDQDVDSRPPTPPEWDRQVTRPDDPAATQMRASCTFKRGAMPAETLGKSTPVDKDIPIDTVVVVMMENHSFDNYFGRFAKYSGESVEAASDTATNPTKLATGDSGVTDSGADGGAGDAGPSSYPYTHAPHLCALDTNHEWDGAHTQYDNGAMDGFVVSNEGWDLGALSTGADPSLASGARAMYYYDERDLPFYYQLAKTFSIADHYHCGLLGPTWPNRMYLIAATSFGKTVNIFPDIGLDQTANVTVLDELEKRHVNWGLFADGAPGAGVVYNAGFLNRWGRNVKFPVTTSTDASDFISVAKAGKLPQVSFVDPLLGGANEGPAGYDEHPPAQIQIGQKFTSDIVHALMSSPQWAHTALFITWDEHGGYYDHVPPPSACVPDDKPASPGSGAFDRYGVRVPLIVVSPYSKKGYVGHTVYDHTSITKFIETKFKVPALTNRDANADALMDLFDFSSPAYATPPKIDVPTIDQGEAAYCVKNFTMP